MSKASTTSKQQPSPAITPNASAWSRGPPTAASNTSSNVPSAVPSPSPPNGASANESAAGAAPVAIGGSASKRGSLMVGGNGDVMPRGNLAFGTVDSPNPLLSSSPAAPAATGSHLADAVKSFGSIDAETTATGASMIRPPRRTSGGANPTAPSGLPQKKLDVHSLFAGKPQSANSASAAPMSPSQQPTQVGSPIQDRRQSIGQNYAGANGLPATAPHPYGQSAAGQPPHLRPPQSQGQPRSPVMGVAQQQQFAGQVPQGQPFRVPQQPQMQGSPAPVRPGGASGPMGVPRPMMGQPTMPFMPPGQNPGYGMMYPSYYNPYDQQHYMAGAGQWAPPANMPLSPRAAQAQLGQQPSPAPPSAPLPASASNSPMPTPPSRPQSLVGGQPSSPMPSTPSRPTQPASPYTPQMTPTSAPGTPGLSAVAMAFTPRTKQTIKISRPDGTSVNLAEAAAAAKGPSSVSSSGVATPDVAVAEEAPKKKMPSLPVIVRLESEEQKKTRLAEEEKRRKIKEEEAKEEQERKDRLERRAKEEEDRKTKEEEERKAKEDEDKKAKEKEEADKVEKASEEATVKAEASPAVASPAEASPAAVQTDESEPSTTVGDNAAPASEKVDETRRALLTPSSQSAAASPLQSPALAAAGLPAKPVSAINGARRPTPSALDVKSATQTSSAPSTPSALSSAKPIDDLDSVDYPSTVKPQRAELNANSSPGKFRYDRDFLMQFMEVCKDKPETLPSLEEIGLEADSSSGFGQGRRGGNRTSMPGTSRTGSGIGGSRSFPSGPAGGMGSFGFSGGASSYRNNATSEERYKHSLQNRVGSTMARTSSQGGSMFVPMGGSSRSGNNRSQRGGKRMPQERSASSAMDPDVAPLAVTANAWVNARSAPTDEKSPAFIERKVKSLLNKLTEEKFESISAQILEWANKSKEETDGMTLKLVIKLVFEKSTDESHWSAMYAKLCRLLLDRVDPQVSEVIDGKSVAGGSLFRKYLLGRCQADFEAGWKAREEAALLASAKSEEDKERLAKAEVEKEKEGGDTVMMSDEYYTAQKAKRRGLGLVQLIGELYKLEMLSKTVIRECLVRLLGNVENPDEEDLESTCKLLTTVGGQFEKASSQQLDVVFERLTSITANDNITSRIRFMIMDIIDLRKHRWQSKKEVVPTTIAQIHQQAARENAEKAQAARESISRGGSRAGHSRRENTAQPGEWQSVATGRPPQRPTDLSNFGRGVSSAGLPNTPTFGPTGVFGRGRKAAAAGNTPPLSRHSSTTNMSNMFGILNEAGDGSAAEASTDSAPERKKLQLAPRTKPIPAAEDGEGEHEGSDDGEQAEGEGEGSSMTEEEVKAKIAMDVKELWGEKDAGGSRNPADIVEYYTALPAEFRYLLSERLGEDAFRIAKIRDAEVVAKGWKAALAAEVATAEDLKKGLLARMPTLDDDAIDFPQAYKAIAIFMRTLSLDQEEIDALTDKVEVYGEPRITPKMKLEKALGQVDEEATAASA